MADTGVNGEARAFDAQTAKVQEQLRGTDHLAKEPIILDLENRLAGLASQETNWQQR